MLQTRERITHKQQVRSQQQGEQKHREADADSLEVIPNIWPGSLTGVTHVQHVMSRPGV